MRRRLRKKRRLGEFQELGVELTLTLQPGTDFDGFLDSFIADAVEAHGLRFGGGGHGVNLSGVVELGRRDVSAAKRDRLTAWLAKEPRIASFTVGEYADLWHGPWH